MKFIKILGIKVVYLFLFIMLSVFVLTTFLDIFNKYFNCFNLSNEVNLFLQNVALAKVNKEKAEEVINFLLPTTTITVNSAGLESPFKVISKEKEALE